MSTDELIEETEKAGMMIDELIEKLEGNPELDSWFLNSDPDPERLEVFIKANGKFFYWREDDVLMKVNFTPAPTFD